jgi:hypothetical protein
VRLPNYQFVVTLDLEAYELSVAPDKSSYCYRPCLLGRVLAPDQRALWRSLKPSEAMIKVSHGCYLVTHACVTACHCPHCGADVGVLCGQEPRGGGARRLTTETHYMRRDLYRAALKKAVC